jgi:hypothetical protein
MKKTKSKKELVAVALKSNPHRSNTAIAHATRSSTWTVGHYRRYMEATGEIPYVRERIGVDGRLGRGPKPIKLRKPKTHCLAQPVYQPVPT